MQIKKNNKIRVISIDPGYEKMGVSVIEKNEKNNYELIFSSCLKTSKEDPHSLRLYNIGLLLNEIIFNHKPDFLAIETLFFNSNQKTALKVAEARGVVLFRSAENKIPVFEFTPLQIKTAVTGYGRSDKKQIISMVNRLIEIKNIIKDDDEYDAIALGLTFFSYFKSFDIYPQLNKN